MADIVDDKEQVNQFSTATLKMLFQYRSNTRSDTHDTLKCKRCSSVVQVDTNTKLNEKQTKSCIEFLDNFQHHLETTILLGKDDSICVENEPKLPSKLLQTFDELKEMLINNKFTSLPLYSKQLRKVMEEMELKVVGINETNNEIVDGNIDEKERESQIEFQTFREGLPPGYSLKASFLTKWVEVVPTLTRLGKNVEIDDDCNSDNDDDNNIDHESVEQIGCPEETDFNKWSHHCGVQTVDDDVLMRSMADDDTISFVFGLEVNWDLLQLREEEKREEVELKKEQMKKDLEELNRKRRMSKSKESADENLIISKEEEEVVAKKSKSAHGDNDIEQYSKKKKEKGKAKKKKIASQKSIEGNSDPLDISNDDNSEKKNDIDVKPKNRRLLVIDDDDDDDDIYEKSELKEQEESIHRKKEKKKSTLKTKKTSGSNHPSTDTENDEFQVEDDELEEKKCTFDSDSIFSSPSIVTETLKKDNIETEEVECLTLDEENVIERSPLKDVTNKRKDMVTDSLVAMSNSKAQVNSQHSGSSIDPQEDGNSWDCPICTYLNYATENVCDMCDYKRQSKPRKARRSR